MPTTSEAAGTETRRLFVYNGGFWTKPRIHRIMCLAGWRPSFGLPHTDDTVGVWGASPTAWRGRAIAARCGASLLTVEDAFLRSVLPGRGSGAVARRGPIGLLIDPAGLHSDPSRPSLIEKIVSSGATTTLRDQASDGIARLQALDLSKYNAHRPDLPAPMPGYVLVVDQTRNDASLIGAGRDEFLAMLNKARDENPGKRILVRAHPETSRGLRPGHFTPADMQSRDEFNDSEVSPWRLLQNAEAVYAMSSQLGYEAILAGHRPRIFGLPFYAGWGLSDDETPFPEGRRAPATKEDLFAASHLLAPTWYDPCRDQLTDFNGAVDQLEAEVKAWRQDRDGHIAYGMRLWKRRFITQTFGDSKGLRFAAKPSAGVTLAWASKADDVPQAARVEDGFLRSRGLGATLIPPLSLIADDLGIYYDPAKESRLERIIASPLPPGAEQRARRLVDTIHATGLSKYNLSVTTMPLPDSGGRRRILLPGQVEDDASVLLGAGAEKTNLQLLQRVRRENPNAYLIYKPHPDVEAGLRIGSVTAEDLKHLADHVARDSNPISLLKHVDEVWTITSTLGFEALLRNVPVTVLGAPFYAGWGLTRDLGVPPERRRARPTLAALAHACLIAYPRYRDPVTGLPCPAEIAVQRLTEGATRQGPDLRILAKIQGALASYSWLWRR
ncbi:capsular polysaccharide biosynthesis protein [Paracoccus sp. 11-3]|uniref:Capsular polysaccharide biosynthesis protein n=1 Tax=Paracoccus amoyensis TaxID=2760093 RepID=A0A926GEM4_9RHOB|nr:capsular polysaccharide biosynthesis protein [Paracoccus amoyensis]MBC9245954.1 capsular polysaccharide biosynthesis protein [Paracoccus amoyensis]